MSAFTRLGFMLDISRCKVPTPEGLHRWIRLLHGFGFNELQLYTEHTFAYSAHEPVWRDASPLTPSDIAVLRTDCAAHGIELVPNQNCFGHFERWLRLPEYRPFAEAPDGFTTPWGDRRDIGSVLRPDGASFRLVAGLLDELLPLFDSEWVNIGCDETFELGQGASRDRCEREGRGRVYTDFLLRIMQHVRAHGRKPQFWGDILLKHPDQLHRLPPEALALDWGYEADHPFEKDCGIFASSGLPFAVCPGTSSWNSFAGRSDNMIANIALAARCGAKAGATGLILADWGDNGHLQQEPVSWPALAWAALLARDPDKASPEEAWKLCDRIAFGGERGATRHWLALGRASERLGIFPANRNALFGLFRSPEPTVPEEALHDLLAHLDALHCPDAEADAWRQTRRNLRLSILRELHRRHPDSRLAEAEAEASDAHARLWRVWNREGGLAESLSFYKKTSPLPSHDGAPR